jgi:2-polyprenyl-3-methyl-5-hydroxy-6-metoxy-1,4-benzoquinol methylase
LESRDVPGPYSDGSDFLEKALAAPPRASLLDIPCGSGRHSIELTRRGYRITGIDLSADFLRLARARAANAQVSLDLRQDDMRGPNVDADAFDGPSAREAG